MTLCFKVRILLEEHVCLLSLLLDGLECLEVSHQASLSLFPRESGFLCSGSSQQFKPAFMVTPKYIVILRYID